MSEEEIKEFEQVLPISTWNSFEDINISITKSSEMYSSSQITIHRNPLYYSIIISIYSFLSQESACNLLNQVFLSLLFIHIS